MGPPEVLVLSAFLVCFAGALLCNSGSGRVFTVSSRTHDNPVEQMLYHVGNEPFVLRTVSHGLL